MLESGILMDVMVNVLLPCKGDAEAEKTLVATVVE
jgi:hypothetical protein